MAAVAPGARHATDAKELRLDSVAVVIDAKYVLCRRLACVAEAHLCKHLFTVSCRAHVEYAGYSSMRLAERAVTLMAEEGRELAVVILTWFCFAVGIIEGDVEHVILERVARRRLVWSLHVVSFEVGSVEMEPTVFRPEGARCIRAAALEDFERAIAIRVLCCLWGFSVPGGEVKSI